LRREFNKQLRSVDNDRRRRDSDSEEFKEVVNKQHGLSERAQLEAKIRNLSAKTAQEKNNYQARANEEQDNYRENMKAQSAEFAAGIDRKANEVNAEKLITITHEREKADAKVAAREKQNLTERD